MSAERRAQAIHAFQRAEIARLATDRQFAALQAQRDHYSRIGTWPGAAAGSRVLEVGCGPGRYAAILASLGCNVVAVDPARFDTWTIVERAHAVQFRADVRAEAMPYADADFDAVSCLGALLYFDDPHQALREMRRVLRTQGHLIVRTVNSGTIYRRLRGKHIDPATRSTYSMPELLSVLRAHGFAPALHFSYGLYAPVFPQWWWYLMNGAISIDWQERLSSLIPAHARTNHVVFAQRVD